MIIAIDTSSLLSLVRYYLPFDTKNVLFETIKSKITTGEIIIIDAVVEECKYTSKGLVLASLPFLTDREFNKKYKFLQNTEFIFPPAPRAFYNKVDNQFVNGASKNRLTEAQYDVQKNEFLNSADMRLILTCLNLKKDYPLEVENIFLVTEETETGNDGKVFKKIPAICSQLGIQTINIQQLIAKFDSLKIEISAK